MNRTSLNRHLQESRLVFIVRSFVAFMLGLVLISSARANPAGADEANSADFHVSTRGDDNNPGTLASPFATLAKARDAVRAKVRAGLTKNVSVLIHGGVYPQKETLTFGLKDSGTEKYSITYAAVPGEKVILSGGQKISGWRKGPGEIWTVALPEVAKGEWYFRQLFVDGNRSSRARTPNADSAEPWCQILASTAKEDEEDQPVTVKLGGFAQPFQVKTYANPGDVELVYICNNDMGRKRLESTNEKDQTVTLALPNRWNSKEHGFDWFISFPQPRWKACYLENALEMLDQPGEWYLDRSTGILSYWPRSGEDLTKAEVVAPVLQKTLLAVSGTRETPVRNLHFSGLRIEHLDWVPPDWGYMGLFCSTIDTGPRDRLQHGFIDAAVEFEHVRSSSFTDGGIAHVGGMGLCLRRGTAGISVEGNEIGDLGAGGIGISEIRQKPIGQRAWNPLPQADDYQGYKIVNNHIHHCGTDYYGSIGITAFMMQDSIIAHNLIHDTAYSGLTFAGDTSGQPAFTKNNTIEFNHIYNTMKVTADGAGMYITYAHGGETLIRGNLIHDTFCNPYRRGESELAKSDLASHGLYLDGGMSGARYEHNVVYKNAGGPLLFNSHQNKNAWFDNLFLRDGTLPPEFIEVLQARAGLEPAYRKSILGQEPNPCQFSVLSDPATATGWSAYQFHLPALNRGVVQIVRRAGCTAETVEIKLGGLQDQVNYALQGFTGSMAPAADTFYDDTLVLHAHRKKQYLEALGDLPILSGHLALPLAKLGLPTVGGRTVLAGKDLLSSGLTLKLDQSAQVIWITYGRTE